MSNSNYRTQTTETQGPWYVATDWTVEPELTEAKRDSDGRFLRQNVKLETVVRVQSASNVEMANLYGVDADELFAGRR